MVVGTVIDYEENNNSNNYYFESVIHTGFPKRGVVSSVMRRPPVPLRSYFSATTCLANLAIRITSHHSLTFFVGGVVFGLE